MQEVGISRTLDAEAVKANCGMLNHGCFYLSVSLAINICSTMLQNMPKGETFDSEITKIFL